MVIADLVERAIEFATSTAIGYSFEAGLLATAIIVLYHGHSVIAFIQTAANAMRIAFFGAGAVLLLLVVSLSMGWLSVGSLPSLSGLVEALPLVAGGVGL